MVDVRDSRSRSRSPVRPAAGPAYLKYDLIACRVDPQRRPVNLIPHSSEKTRRLPTLFHLVRLCLISALTPLHSPRKSLAPRQRLRPDHEPCAATQATRHRRHSSSMAPIRRYLRITKYSVLECRIYLDNPALAQSWLLSPRDPVLPRVIEAVRPFVLPKLREERERSRKKSAKKRGIKDTVTQGASSISPPPLSSPTPPSSLPLLLAAPRTSLRACALAEQESSWLAWRMLALAGIIFEPRGARRAQTRNAQSVDK